MATTPIPNHIEQAKARLIEQYKDKPLIAALIEAEAQQIQDLEDAANSIETKTALSTAVGIQLDIIGELVGLQRTAGLDDETYRVLLRSKINQNISQGEPVQVIGAFKILSGATLAILSEGSASLMLMGDGPDLTQDQINQLYVQVKKVMAAGVRLDHLGQFAPAGDAFAFAGSTSAKGFGSTSDPAQGGQLGHLYVNKNKEFAFAGEDPKGGGFGTLEDNQVGGVLT